MWNPKWSEELIKRSCIKAIILNTIRSTLLAVDIYFLVRNISVLVDNNYLAHHYASYYTLEYILEPVTGRKTSHLVPIWIDIQKKSDDESQIVGDLFCEGYKITNIGCTLIIAGIIYNVCYVLSKGYRILVTLVVILMLAGSLCLVLGTTKCSRLQQPCLQKVRTKLKEALRANYIGPPGNAVTSFFNRVMIKHDCCGVDGPMDFWDMNLNISFTKKARMNFDAYFLLFHKGVETSESKHKGPIFVPPACCKDKVFDYYNERTRFESALECVKDKYFMQVNKQGCYKPFVQEKLELSAFSYKAKYIMCIIITLTTSLHACMVLMPAPDVSNNQEPVSKRSEHKTHFSLFQSSIFSAVDEESKTDMESDDDDDDDDDDETTDVTEDEMSASSYI